jgi:hypothetical protein
MKLETLQEILFHIVFFIGFGIMVTCLPLLADMNPVEYLPFYAGGYWTTTTLTMIAKRYM